MWREFLYVNTFDEMVALICTTIAFKFNNRISRKKMYFKYGA